MGVSERITVTCSMATFHMPAPTAPVSPRRWPDFYAFHAEVETDTTRAVFTVHLGDEPLREGYELHLEGRKGHHIHAFDEEDILDRPAPGVVRYVWHHGQQNASPDGHSQHEGDFRLLLYTHLKMATVYLSLPHFDAQGQPIPSDLPRDANRKP